MRTRLPALIFLVILAQLSFPQLLGEIPLASTATITIHENGTIFTTSGTIVDLQANLSVPRQSPYQVSDIGERLVMSREGNNFIPLFAKNPGNSFKYSKVFTVKTTYRATPALPDSYSVPQEYRAYIEPTERTQSGSPKISALAKGITAGASDPFEKVARLAIYVNSHINYTDSETGNERDALWVLENGKGVCVEYATLFAALARAEGIPVRYLSGYAYDERREGWVGHTWNEAYIGEWVPVDATWLEVGALDALHIEVSRQAELSRESRLVARVTNLNAQIVWKTDSNDGLLANNIMLGDVSFLPPISGYVAGAAEARLPTGESTMVHVTIRGADYRVVAATLSSCRGESEMRITGGKGGMQYLILRPGQEASATWEVASPSSLAPNYVYTCPLTVNSPYLARRTVEMTIDPSLSKKPAFSAALSRQSFLSGEQGSVFLSAPPSRLGKKASVHIPGSAVIPLAIGSGFVEVPFVAQGNGEHEAYAAMEGGGFARLRYSVSDKPSALKIESFSLPNKAFSGRQASARAKVSASSYPSDIYLQFSAGGRRQEVSARIDSAKEVEFIFIPSEEGTMQALLFASQSPASGVSDSAGAFVAVLAAPSLSVSSVVTTKKPSGGLSTKLSFSSSGSLYSPSLEVGGGRHSAAGDVEIALPAGTHPITLRWSDSEGGNYEKRGSVTIVEPGIVEDIAAKASAAGAPPPPCPLALALLLVPFIAAFARRH